MDELKRDRENERLAAGHILRIGQNYGGRGGRVAHTLSTKRHVAAFNVAHCFLAIKKTKQAQATR